MKIGFKNQRVRSFIRKKSILLIFLFFVAFTLPLITSSVSLSMPSVQNQQNTAQWVEKAKENYQTRQFESAIPLWQQAVETFATQGDTLNQAMALSNLSLTHQQLGQWDEAKKAIAQSLALLDTVKKNNTKQRILAETLEIKGKLALNLGQSANALENWQKATTIYQEMGEPNRVRQSQINQAQAMQSLGFYPRACTTLLDALDFKSEDCQIKGDKLPQVPENMPTSLQILGLRSLGNVLRVTGQPHVSHRVLLKSWELAERNEDKESLAEIALSLGNTVRILGNQKITIPPSPTPINLTQSVSCPLSEDDLSLSQWYQSAIACYHQAEQSPSSLTRVQAQLNLLSLWMQLGQSQELPTLIAKIEAELTNSPPNDPTVAAQLKFAQQLMCLRSQFTTDETLPVTPILQSCPIVENPHFEAITPPTWTKIQQKVTIALNQAQTLGDKAAQANSLGYLGATYQGMGQPIKAQQSTVLALQQISAFENPELAYFWQWQLGRLYYSLGKKEEAIAAYRLAVEILESLRGDLVTSNADIQFNFRDSVEPVYRELVDQLLEPTGQISENTLKEARNIIESLQLAELNNFFRENCLEAEFQAVDQLDPDAAVIYPIVLPQRIAIILSLPQKPLSYYETAFNQNSGYGTLEQLEPVFDELFANLNPFISSPYPLEPHQQFYNWLIRPLEATLEANHIKTLVFVLDGLLRNIPMAALHDGQQYLIEKYNIALAPGLHLLRPSSLSEKPLKTLAGGLAQARQGFSSLPGVKAEVQEISAVVSTEVLLDEDFTRNRLQREIEETSFPVVHLATHGQFSSQAEETFLLTWDERINVKNLDQLLRKRIKQQRNPIELLILSACQTATGDKRAVLGLAGTAVRSGAQSTLATLWSVQDQSTADLIAQFYQYLSQSDMSKAEALRQAQLSLLRSPQYQHPFYWAPFVLVGNWL